MTNIKEPSEDFSNIEIYYNKKIKVYEAETMTNGKYTGYGATRLDALQNLYDCIEKNIEG